MSKAKMSQKHVNDEEKLPGTRPEKIEIGMDGQHQRRPGRERCYLFLVAFFCLVALLFIVLFILYKDKDGDSRDKDFTVCTTLDCVKTGAEFSSEMDLEVDPCQDFAQYSCGRFVKETVIPDDQNIVDHFTAVVNKGKQIAKVILEEEVKPNDPDFVIKMKHFYQACMDEDQIEKVGLQPYLENEKLQEWPTLNAKWDASTFDLSKLVVDFSRVSSGSLFSFDVVNNFTDSSVYAFMLSEPSLGLSSASLKETRNHSTIMAYQEYYVDIAVASGADETVARRDAREMVDFEVELAKIFVSSEDETSVTKNNPMSLDAMSEKYSYFDWHGIVQAIFDSINVTVDSEMTVNVNQPTYFENLTTVLNNTSARAIQNRVAFHYVQKILPDNKRDNEIDIKFRKASGGETKQLPRWKNCVQTVIDVYGWAFSKVFVERTFSEKAKHIMKEMIANLKAVFKEMINEAKWIGQTTKKAALIKLERIEEKIGYPDIDFSYKDMNKKYENYTVVKDDFYRTVMDANAADRKAMLYLFFKRFHNKQWTITPNTVNAFYEAEANAIRNGTVLGGVIRRAGSTLVYNENVQAFPAGFLQPVFFSEKYPNSVNYGAIGLVIGHEITHGFDNRGRHHDENGNVRDWWLPEDAEEFNRRSECLVNQYSSIIVDQVSMNVNGKATLGENTADNVGMKEAFRAYKRFSASQPSKELPLPGLGLTPDQQFFVGYARTLCEKLRDSSMRHQINSDSHTPGLPRINGAVQNSEDFARAFNCPIGSPMNPSKKCSVW